MSLIGIIILFFFVFLFFFLWMPPGDDDAVDAVFLFSQVAFFLEDVLWKLLLLLLVLADVSVIDVGDAGGENEDMGGGPC